jgi:hypothetical protein
MNEMTGQFTLRPSSVGDPVSGFISERHRLVALSPLSNTSFSFPIAAGNAVMPTLGLTELIAGPLLWAVKRGGVGTGLEFY